MNIDINIITSQPLGRSIGSCIYREMGNLFLAIIITIAIATTITNSTITIITIISRGRFLFDFWLALACLGLPWLGVLPGPIQFLCFFSFVGEIGAVTP